jgi:hypothetical protein
MKLKFKISPRFPVAPDLAKQVARFCARLAKPICLKKRLELPSEIIFTLTRKGGYRNRSGSAARNRRESFYRRKPVRIRLGEGFDSGVHMERQYKYADSPVCPCDGQTEVYLHLVAHELGHAICGFEGNKVGEFQCENFGRHCLEEWRMATQDPAAMI